MRNHFLNKIELREPIMCSFSGSSYTSLHRCKLNFQIYRVDLELTVQTGPHQTAATHYTPRLTDNDSNNTDSYEDCQDN